MIPKVIHYCWFGRNPKSELIQKCIDSWHCYCPDYEIVEWNEDNFDVNSIPYTADAYADKKWAFVSDYARLKVVYENGGIYLDTDVLLHNSLNHLLKYSCWLASDDVRYIATGLGFGAERENPLICKMMKEYERYQYPAGTNVILDTKVVENELPQWKKSDKTQTVGTVRIIGVSDYGEIAKHLYTYSWADEKTRRKREQQIISGSVKKSTKLLWKIKCFMRNPTFVSFFDKHNENLIGKIYTFLAYDFLDYGLIYYLKKLFK